MQRILENTSATIRRTFTVDGTATDADGNVTLGITDEAGNVVVAAGTLAPNTGTGIYAYTLAPQTQVNKATVTWTGTWSGVAQTSDDEILIVGAHLFTETEARATRLSDLSDATVYTDAILAEARDKISDMFERICGQSFIPMYARQTMAGTGGYHLQLPATHRHVGAVIEATINGVDVSANVTAHPDLPLLSSTSGVWTLPTVSNPYNVTVAYRYGLESPPLDIKQAALKVLHQAVVESPIPDRAVSLTDELGTIRLAVPGRFGQHFGIPEVDAVLDRHMARSLVY